MRIGVISDTHGSKQAINWVVNKAGAVAMWLHAGDYSQDADYLARLAKVPVFAAKGNCDGHTAAKVDEFVEIGAKKIWLTHGHRYNVKEGHRELRYWGREYGVDIVIYGHTHIPVNQREGNLLIFNPGSTTFPRFDAPSFGILELDEAEQLTAAIITLDKNA